MENLLNNRAAEESIYSGQRMEIGKKVVTLLLRAYKWAISPMLLPACRYWPTCSEYAMEAVERYGVLLGGAKAAWRLMRCHPLARGGVDPVVKIPSGNISRPDFCNH